MNSSDNNQNIFWFAAKSMREVYEKISSWQQSENKRILSFHMEKDGEEFCAIVATNPMEVIIMDGERAGGASVIKNSMNDHRYLYSTSG